MKNKGHLRLKMPCFQNQPKFASGTVWRETKEFQQNSPVFLAVERTYKIE